MQIRKVNLAEKFEASGSTGARRSRARWNDAYVKLSSSRGTSSGTSTTMKTRCFWS